MTNSKKTILDFLKKKESSEKIAVLTSFDFFTSKIIENSGIDAILVGDSLGMVFGGMENTLQVTIEEMVYHTKAVRRGAPNSFIIADLPFSDYKTNPSRAVSDSIKLVQEGFANSVKMEGGLEILESIKKVVENQIPVMGHLGLTPQSINKIGKFSKQSDKIEYQNELLKTALELQKAGCFAIVLEMVPKSVASFVSKNLRIPIIGIGSGSGCDGQVLVTQDILGLTDFPKFKFVRRYANLKKDIQKSVESYVADVKSESFPREEESF